MKERRRRDEEELQELLADVPGRPDPSTLECSFCSERASKWVATIDAGIEPEEIDGDEMLPVCDGCWGASETCSACYLGVCSEHLIDDEGFWTEEAGVRVRELIQIIGKVSYHEDGDYPRDS